MIQHSRIEVVRNKSLDETGFGTAYDLGTGFMLISRQTILNMMEKYPELKYKPEGMSEDDAKWFYALFDTVIVNEEGMSRYLSEDYAFCRRVQNMGEEVYLDTTIKLKHVGTHVFG